MNAGRIETYTHTDHLTANKGAAIAKIGCLTDFAARTDDFAAFSKKAAKFIYAASAASWDDVVSLFPEIDVEKSALEKSLREKISISDIHIVRL